MSTRTKLELTRIGKENRPKRDDRLALKALEQESAGKVKCVKMANALCRCRELAACLGRGVGAKAADLRSPL